MQPREVPLLELVPTAAVRFHEHPERRRTLRLVERLRRDRLLRNPPIVASPSPGVYVLLDGANRVSAFRELGWPQVPVQVVNYESPDLVLRQWHHLLLQGAGLGLLEAYRRLAGVRLESVTPEQLPAILDGREVFAALVDETRRCWGIFPEPRAGFDLGRWMAVLERVVGAYEGRSQLERIKWAEYTDLPPVYQEREHQLVLFPGLAKPELLQIVAQGLLIPTGITRHIVPGRALALNLDLDFLTRLQDDVQRQEHFGDFVRQLEIDGRIRYYEESVFLLNE